MSIILFNMKDIKITAKACSKQVPYQNLNGSKLRLDRFVSVEANFFGLMSVNEHHVDDLIFIKAACTYFMHGFWKRNGSPTEHTAFPATRSCAGGRTITLECAQQKNQSSLRIKVKFDDLDIIDPVRECYLNAHEVLTLDAALNKTINLIHPQEESSSSF